MDRIQDIERTLRDRPYRWLVTGGAGFIGSHLVDRLLHLRQTVVVLDNLATGSRANLDLRNLTFHEGDIRDADTCIRAMEGVDRVLHQAALGSVPRSIDDPKTTFAVNVDGFENILEAARTSQVKSLVYASSSSVYGGVADLPATETAPLSPKSPYAASKAANEVLARGWSEAFGLPVVGLRYFNVCGARQSPNGPYSAVIPRWVAQLRSGQVPTIFGDGGISRDFCPVDDVVQANLLAAFAPETSHGRVYNVALGQVTTLDQLYALVRDAVARSGVDCASVEPTFGPVRAGDVRHSHADLTAISRDLGYTPRSRLYDAIEAAVG